MEQPAQTVRLKLPEQDLPHLTLGADQPKKLEQWVESLPIMNMGETARQLYQFIQELNRLQIDSKLRFQLLEVVRPSILHVSDSLQKHYLNQSLVLPEKARRVASLAQALQGHLANGYKLVAVRGIRKVKDKAVRRAVTTAIHRAVTALGDTLLRCYQLYFPSPRHLWLELHQLFLLAELHGISATPVVDGEVESSIQSAYARCLLLATAKPNQLRQQELAGIYKAAFAWAPLIEISTASDDDDLFVFDLQADRPPIYRTHASQASQSWRYIDSTRLVEAITAWLRAPGDSELVVPKSLNEGLLTHLQQVWGALTERAFKRMPESGEIELCFGLVGVHYFLSGKVAFETMVERGSLSVLSAEEEHNPFLANIQKSNKQKQQNADPWATAYQSDYVGETIEMGAPGSQRSEGTLPVSYHCQKVNASPGGYCLSWQGNTPSLMRTGELLALRDHPDSQWSLAVVRWVTQLPNHGARFGVELLAPGGRPVAARALRKQGLDSDFMRGVVLPELAAVGQPATLLLPTVGFNEGVKVELVEAGEPRRVQLLRRTQGASGFSQYPFRDMATPAPTQSPEGGDDDALDSIWSSL
ncbi:hypothetical protein A3754_08660 [Alcanivorax sp. HI0083]|uniref:hypothetical protein n=1 Tax=unclassified Alcanivorax TaxID=2638842 RepID=UPI0007BAB2F1|nr:MULTISPECIES: hypothetical protein [unclassified Alcanivorax]KZY37164.1 hypothetical protein A3730_11950 [Alcanivorax sp. HI0044]KZZ27153.1 hypothetical protein A3754_08660 [Alcanivorax sp. HI0083]